jgi:hypothetical protein
MIAGQAPDLSLFSSLYSKQSVGLVFATAAFLGMGSCIFDAYTRLKAAFCPSFKKNYNLYFTSSLVSTRLKQYWTESFKKVKRLIPTRYLLINNSK